jgi:hypothetical protein
MRGLGIVLAKTAMPANVCLQATDLGIAPWSSSESRTTSSRQEDPIDSSCNVFHYYPGSMGDCMECPVLYGNINLVIEVCMLYYKRAHSIYLRHLHLLVAL